MRKIVIVPKAHNSRQVIENPRGGKSIIGLDRGINIFKKSFSEKLEENLIKELKENNLDYSVEIDRFYGPIEFLVNEEDDLVLISPYIKNIVDTSNMERSNYYLLNENEFLEGNVENIIKHLVKNNSK